MPPLKCNPDDIWKGLTVNITAENSTQKVFKEHVRMYHVRVRTCRPIARPIRGSIEHPFEVCVL